MTTWFGGTRTILSGTQGGWPGKLHRETFIATVAEVGDAQGHCWHGVRLQTQIAGQPSFKGIRAEIDYLTVPGSNLLKAVFRLFNETDVYRSAGDPMHAFMLYCQVDGVRDNGTLYGKHANGTLIQRKRSSNDLWLRAGKWGAVVNPASGRALSVFCPGTPDSVLLMDSGTDGGHLLVSQSKKLAQQSISELGI